MKDYIERGTAFQRRPEKLNLNIDDPLRAEYAKGWNAATDMFFDEIAAIPAANVREVVLCKDCKHCKDGFICNNGHWNGMTFPSNFCSDGERKNQR